MNALGVRHLSQALVARHRISLVTGTLCLLFFFQQVAEAQQGTEFIEAAPASFGDAAMRNDSRSIGFSFGMSESISSKIQLPDGGTVGSIRFTSIHPSLFVRQQGVRTQFSMDYRPTYSHYTGRQSDSSVSHNGTLRFSRRLSPRTTFGITAQASSVVNDYGTALGPGSLVNFGSGFIQGVDVPRQRVTQSVLTTTMSYQAGQRLHLATFGSYEFFQYGMGTIGDSQGIQVGVQSNYQMNKYVSLNNSIATYVKRLSDTPRSNIHRVQIGGLGFRPRLGAFEFSIGGGIDIASYNREQQFGANGRATISRQSTATLLTIGYGRGFSGAAGSPEVFTSDNVAASYTRWLSRRVNFRLDAQYNAGSSRSGATLNYLQGSVGLGFAITNHAVVSAQYSYLSQELYSLNVGEPRSNRYWAGASLQYLLPSLRIR